MKIITATGTTAETDHDEEADEGTDHIDVAMGKVENLQDSIYQRVAKSDQRVNAT